MKKIKENIEFLGLSPQKELAIVLAAIALFLAAEVGLYFFKGFGFMLAVPVIVLILFLYLDLSKFSSMRRQKQAKLTEEFVHLFTFFGIYIHDGYNVYNALQALEPFASPDFKKVLITMLEEIENDKSVAPFIRFASTFADITIKEVMISVYQMIDEGQGGAYITQFTHLFGKLSDEKHKLIKEKKIEKLETLAFLPLAGSGFIMIMLTLAIMEIMGGLMNNGI